MVSKTITAISTKGNHVKGEVVLVFNDALTSGSNQYVSITLLLVQDDKGQVFEVRPRDVISIEPDPKVQSPEPSSPFIKKTLAEIQSNFDRQKHAELLITLLPSDHEGRATWLLNYGVAEEAQRLRRDRGLKFDPQTNACETSGVC